MIELRNFKDKELNISWKLIDIGFHGSKEFYEELSSKDIINYAISTSENDFKDLAYKRLVEKIACEYEDNYEKLDYIIKELVKLENNIDYKLEFRKWVYMYVYINLKKNSDYIQGLIELTELWAKLNFPDFSPHIVQGVNNDIIPQEYYTAENYNNLLRKHFEWLEAELENIKKEENSKETLYNKNDD
ncbi:MAG: DUF2247 family protein [Clostridia bacterium]|nr:DUF2247 family protein [Clostridia bacterium]